MEVSERERLEARTAPKFLSVKLRARETAVARFPKSKLIPSIGRINAEPAEVPPVALPVVNAEVRSEMEGVRQPENESITAASIPID